VRFGLMSFPGDGMEVEADARLAVEAGFDTIATGDHLRHPRDPVLPLLDGWSVLTAWAATTDQLRVAMLVSNLIYRHPVLVAKQAIAVDQFSNGRLDLGVGAGVYPTDHAMAGVPLWAAGDRIERLSEFVCALDVGLRGSESFEGDFYPFREASWSPGPVQRPRPPIAIGAVGPRVLRLTAAQADVWSAFGGISMDDEEAFFSALADQTRTLERCCEEIGRDPQSLRRSLLAFRPLAPWRSVDDLERIASAAHSLGFDELIVYKPADTDERRVFEKTAATLATLKQM
jgi:alkanesulfonate monooxygenase SsuD/methylene tetrahydromethanopterin reductase-like flavin-dependent oxidoreductase (luciferase family)